MTPRPTYLQSFGIIFRPAEWDGLTVPQVEILRVLAAVNARTMPMSRPLKRLTELKLVNAPLASNYDSARQRRKSGNQRHQITAKGRRLVERGEAAEKARLREFDEALKRA